MVEVTGLSAQLIDFYKSLVLTLPVWLMDFINLFLLVLLIVIYSIFIWKFYRFISTKNLIELNLSQYNRSEHPVFTKLIAGTLYFVEYIVILPFLIFFWFITFAIFLIFLTEGFDVKAILIISATIIGAIRVICYIPKYGENLARELAKLWPLTLLAIAVSKPGFLSIERILNHFHEIPIALGDFTIFLLFIIILEILLRSFDFIFMIFGLNEQEVED